MSDIEHPSSVPVDAHLDMRRQLYRRGWESGYQLISATGGADGALNQLEEAMTRTDMHKADAAHFIAKGSPSFLLPVFAHTQRDCIMISDGVIATLAACEGEGPYKSQ